MFRGMNSADSPCILEARCTDAFPSSAQLGVDAFNPQLLSQRPHQCLLVFDAAFNRTSHFSDLWVQPGSDPLWIYDVYVRSVSEEGYEGGQRQVVALRELVATKLTLQGLGGLPTSYDIAMGIYGRAHIEGDRHSRTHTCPHNWQLLQARHSCTSW